MPEPAPLTPVSRWHLEALTDEVGIHQHAIGGRPDPAHGYCTDDVARALQVDLLHARVLGWPAVALSAGRNLRFLAEAFDPGTGRFRNFRRIDRTWLDGVASEDANGRAMLALGETIEKAGDPGLVAEATDLFARALPAAARSAALRARSSVLLGCSAALRRVQSGPIAAAHGHLADGLAATFEAGKDPAWPWPEPIVTYENALPVHALIVAGIDLQDPGMIAAGLRRLDWLIASQTAPTGHLSPVGNGWWPAGGRMSQFDQQPIEATALLLAAEAGYRATRDDRYRAAMELAYGWFLGANDLGVRVADPARGAGYDGLTPTGVNLNQGAESTLMWLTALEHLRAMRDPQAAASSSAPVRPPTARSLASAPAVSSRPETVAAR